MLRRFDSDSKQSTIYVFDKQTSKTFSSSIADAGSENHFNSVEINGKHANFERAFQTNDDQTALLLDRIVEAPVISDSRTTRATDLIGNRSDSSGRTKPQKNAANIAEQVGRSPLTKQVSSPRQTSYEFQQTNKSNSLHLRFASKKKSSKHLITSLADPDTRYPGKTHSGLPTIQLLCGMGFHTAR